MLVYTLMIRLYAFAIHLASIKSNKARLWIKGRKNWKSQLPEHLNSEQETIWFHASSLGEFEQARPVIEALQEYRTHYNFVLSFFSPSGFEQKKNYDQVDVVTYLPNDTYSNAKDFIRILNPKIALFVKYDFWFNYISELHVQNRKVVYFSSSFRPNQYFFKAYGRPFLKSLKRIDHIFVQDQSSYNLLIEKGFSSISVTGDTRIDRVIQLSKSTTEFDDLEKHKRSVLVVGSAYDQEVKLARSFAKDFPEYDIILAPHNIDKTKLKVWQAELEKHQLSVSSYTKVGLAFNTRILILDTIGLLQKVYKYADLVLVGGGFGKSVHNILEPAVFEIPVFFGPKHNKFAEAKQLIELGAAFEITDYQSLKWQAMHAFSSRDEVKKGAQTFFYQNAGATQKVVDFVKVQLSDK